MKYKDYKFVNASDSVELTYMQALSYFDETLMLIESSSFDLFDEEEELSQELAQKKYNEVNRRLQTFGQAFELFMKYIIHASRLEKKPNMSIDDLWNKWIRGHQMIPLINEKASSPDVIPNFKEIFNLSLNSYYGIYGWNFINHIYFEFNKGHIDNSKLLLLLLPQEYIGDYSMNDEDIESIITKNSAIYEKCRYNVEKMTNYNFTEVFCFINFVKFFANMIHISNNKTNINYNVAYVHAMVDNPVVYEVINKIRSKEEIDEILNNDFINGDARILSYLLVNNYYSIEDVINISKADILLENYDNLYLILRYKVSLDDIIMYKNNNYNVMFLASDLTFEEIRKIVSIPIIGEYLNKNYLLVNKMLIDKKADIGLTVDDWCKILSCDVFKNKLELIKGVITKYEEIYLASEKNKKCNRIFCDNDNKLDDCDILIERKFVSSKFCNYLIENINNNITLFKEVDFDLFNIPISIDYENAKRIIGLIKKMKIKYAFSTLIVYPYYEVFAIINNMIKSDYDFSSKEFKNDFNRIYESNSLFNAIYKDRFLSDEFMEDNGLYKISDKRYSSAPKIKVISADYNNPLPNLISSNDCI